MRATAPVSLVDHLADCPAPDFDRLARVYRWMEWLSFGPFLSRCRYAFLSTIGNPQTALIYGDGDGRFTARLLHQKPGIRVHAVDASGKMLTELARRSTRYSSRLKTFVADARTFFPPSSRYDLIATHFFLDCMSTIEVEHLASCLREHVSEDALWIISEFAIPGDPFGRLIAKPLVDILYFAFGWLTNLKMRTLPDHSEALKRGGWSLVQRQNSLGGLLICELWRPDGPQMQLQAIPD